MKGVILSEIYLESLKQRQDYKMSRKTKFCTTGSISGISVKIKFSGSKVAAYMLDISDIITI